LLGLFFPSCCFAANYEYPYWILDHPDGSNRYRLNVSVTSSLYDYYRSKDHDVHSAYGFGQFVTPFALKPIADSLWNVYSEDEDFANGVLMIIHQIRYEASGPQKYPVETIVENEGDCDLFSFVVASVMMAGGLDVVLLYYERQDHMNVGVNLSHVPDDARDAVCYFSYSGKRYFMAETTGGNWENGWRVGECPDLLDGASSRIITLEEAEQLSPGQVSSSYDALTTSSITLSLSSAFVIEGGSVTISGSISSASTNRSIIIYAKSGSSWVILTTVQCDPSGRYSYDWKPTSIATYFVRASWSGDADHAGTDSSVQSLRVVPLSLILVVVMSVSFVAVAAVILVVLRRTGTVQEGSSVQ